MNYIVLDTEFNQPAPKLFNPKIKFKPNKICPFEIIEIGAVKLNEKFEQIGTFEIFIKPVIYNNLNPIVKKKTKITMKDLKCGFLFEAAIKHLKKWMNNEEYILCVWSDNDIREIKRNCQYHKIDSEWVDNYIDIQIEANGFFNLPKGQQIGLKNAIDRFDIKPDKRLHRALVDAFYTVEIFRKIRNLG